MKIDIERGRQAEYDDVNFTLFTVHVTNSSWLKEGYPLCNGKLAIDRVVTALFKE